jgi:hypothetical protein
MLVGDQYQKVAVKKGDGVIKYQYALDKKGQRIKVNKEDKTEKWLPERWVGYCNATRKSYTLSTEFVEKNFSPGYIEQTKKVAERGMKHFVNVPPGSDKRHDLLPPICKDTPVVKFRQAEGEQTCLSYSFASALHYAGKRHTASQIFCKSKQIIDKHNTFTLFITMLRTHTTPIFFKRLKAAAWNILENEKDNLVVALLHGSDGKEDHCVTVFGK